MKGNPVPKLIKLLGEGSYGKTYLSKFQGSDKKYATKTYERKNVDGTSLEKYLQNEIFILQELDHPNIVKFKDIHKTKNHYLITMEYCNGGELDKALKKFQTKFNKPFSQEIVQYLMRQIIDAFKYIHSKKIIHRDIKLENISLHFDDEKDKEDLNMMKAIPKIIDFGFSCQFNKAGLQYTTFGTPINMDPILLKKAKSKHKKHHIGYDIKADVWSLGTICYEMLIGMPVFNAQDMEGLVKKVEDGSYVVPTTLSKEVVSFLNAMLQYDSEKRLNCLELSKHAFLTKNIKDFQSIDLKAVSNKICEKGLKINSKKNKTIWAIFNEEDEDKLTKISIKQLNPIEEKDENIFEEQDKNMNTGKNEGNKEKVDSDFEGPTLPTEGIPGNPTDLKIEGAKEKNKNCFIF